MDVMMVVVMMMLGELTTGKRVRTGGYAFTTSQDAHAKRPNIYFAAVVGVWRTHSAYRVIRRIAYDTVSRLLLLSTSNSPLRPRSQHCALSVRCILKCYS
jgi:hypothetical protein